MQFMSTTRVLALLTLPLALAPLARGEVALAGIFGDSMVLQRDQPIALWGTAAPGEEVNAQLSTRSAKTKAGEDGRWSLSLEALPAGGPFELAVWSTNRIRLKDVLLGELWIVAGQSNAELPLAATENGEAEAAKPKSRRMRFFREEPADSPTRLPDLKGGPWMVCAAENAVGWSAIGYYCATELEAELDVPVGLIQCTQSGSPAEPWVERSVLEQDPELAPALARFARKSKSMPGAVFNGMLAPLAPLRIRGVLWYQGESNVKFAQQYRRLFPALIQGWRKLAGQGDFPFLFVQLAGFGPHPKEPGESEWAELRDAQAQARALPATGMVVAADIGDVESLHPTDKRDVGHRLAQLALAEVYGRKVEGRGPSFKSLEVKGSSVRAHFEHAGGGLRAKGGGKLVGFALAGADRKFRWAEATIDGDALVLKAAGVEAPVALRYAWSDNPLCNLENSAHLPAEPFRSDDWAAPAPAAPR
jgi:sialate O-acetylesterase